MVGIEGEYSQWWALCCVLVLVFSVCVSLYWLNSGFSWRLFRARFKFENLELDISTHSMLGGCSCSMKKLSFVMDMECSSKLYNTSSENFPGLSFQNWLQMLRFQKMILHVQIMFFGHSFSHKSMRVFKCNNHGMLKLSLAQNFTNFAIQVVTGSHTHESTIYVNPNDPTNCKKFKILRKQTHVLLVFLRCLPL